MATARLFTLMLQKEKKEEFRTVLRNSLWLIERKNDFGMTLLQCAARKGNIDICRILIENGADLSTLGGFKGNQTALHYAAENSYFFAIYLTLLTKSIINKDLTPQLIQILEQALKSKLTNKLQQLTHLLSQDTPEIFEYVSEQIEELNKMLSFIEKRLPLLMQILPQITPEIFVSLLAGILTQANPEIFSPEFESVLIHVQELKLSKIETISALIPIMQHANDLQNFALLFEQMLDKIQLKSSTSSVIHPSSPIFSRSKSPENPDLDNDVLAKSTLFTRE